MNVIAYSTSTPEPAPVDDRKGWDAVDRMVLRVASHGPRTREEMSRVVPDGFCYRLFDEALDRLAADRLVEERRVVADPRGPVVELGEVRTVYRLTAAGRERLAARTAALSQAA